MRQINLLFELPSSNMLNTQYTICLIHNIQTHPSLRPDRQQIYITAQRITIAVTSNTNVFLPPSRTAADLYHNAVHYNCNNKQYKPIPPAVHNPLNLNSPARYQFVDADFQHQHSRRGNSPPWRHATMLRQATR